MVEKSWKQIETERLILRKFTSEDSAFLLELMNSPTWLQFIGQRNITTTDEARNYILEKFIKSYQTNGFGLNLVVLKNNNTPIGMCGLIKRDSLKDVDIGFALLPRYERKGYGYEAATATMKYAKSNLGLSRIVAITNKNNVQSIHLLQKIGMQFEEMVRLNDTEELMLFANEQ